MYKFSQHCRNAYRCCRCRVLGKQRELSEQAAGCADEAVGREAVSQQMIELSEQAAGSVGQ